MCPGGMGDQTVEYMSLEFKEGVGDAINLRILSKQEAFQATRVDVTTKGMSGKKRSKRIDLSLSPGPPMLRVRSGWG